MERARSWGWRASSGSTGGWCDRRSSMAEAITESPNSSSHSVKLLLDMITVLARSVPPRDELEEQVRLLPADRVPNLIDDDQGDAGKAWDLERGGRIPLQCLDQGGHRREVDADSGVTGLDRGRNDEMGLPHPGWPQEDHVLLPGDDVPVSLLSRIAADTARWAPADRP